MLAKPRFGGALFYGGTDMGHMTTSPDNFDGGATGGVQILLKLEGFALFAVATLLYAKHGMSWWLFAALFLVPDVSLLGYLAGPRIGAFLYNAAHTTLLPILLGVGAMVLSSPSARAATLVWLAHIGIDRTLGYGLKYQTGFGFTHLGRIGKARSANPISATGQTAS